MNREITSENVVPVPRTGNDIRADEGISHYFGRMECRLILLIFRYPVALPRGVSLRGRRFVTWT